MKNKTLIITAIIPLTLFAQSQAWGKCEHQRDIDQVLALNDIGQIRISVNAGDLEISGHSNSDQILIKGKACASKANKLDEIRLVAEQQGNTAVIKTLMPDSNSGSWFGKNSYAYMDLDITVPEKMILEVSDSSGDISISHVGSLSLKDSSGDIEIEDISGDVSVDDSSGGIDIEHILGSVTVRDSSGNMDISDVGQQVVINEDSSGNIYIKDVKASVHIKRDSSGSIYVKDIAGDFRVDRDGSGKIKHKDVMGEVSLPSDD